MLGKGKILINITSLFFKRFLTKKPQTKGPNHNSQEKLHHSQGYIYYNKFPPNVIS